MLDVSDEEIEMTSRRGWITVLAVVGAVAPLVQGKPSAEGSPVAVKQRKEVAEAKEQAETGPLFLDGQEAQD